jgi:predicted lipoprotein with Yx(FWY)xxD motif
MTIATRAFALALVAALGLGACGTTTTTTSGSGGTSAGSATSTTTSTAPASSTTAKAPGTTAAPDGVVELQVVKTPYGDAIGQTEGKAVYAWDKEADGTLMCVAEACTEKWPPVLAGSFKVGAGLNKDAFSLITRPDGTTQVALSGKPLYTMAIDEPGEANCQGVEGWWILEPDGTKNEHTEPVKK